MRYLDEPNFSVPLANSYNERGVAGATTIFTSGKDQRKINCVYETAQNAASGKSTLYLTKRPGCAISATTYGISGVSSYLITNGYFQPLAATQLVFYKEGSDVKVSDGTTSTVILNTATLIPTYLAKTSISGNEHVVVQLTNTSSLSQKVYFSSSVPVWTEITPPGTGFRGQMAFMDGFAFLADPNTNKIYNSDLNSLSSWNPTNFITKQIAQDVPLGLARLGKQIIAFGQNTVEVFQNAGVEVGSPLQTVPQLATRIGLIERADAFSSKTYYAIIGSKMYFIGRLSGGSKSVGVFTFNGSSFDKISPPFIDKLIPVYFQVGSIGVNGQTAFYIALDAAPSSPQRWLMYFPAWNEWFEWNSTVICPTNGGNYFLGVGANQNRIYEFPGTNIWQDDGTNYQFLTQFALPSKGNADRRMQFCGVVGDIATSTLALSIKFSDDDYQTFSSSRTVDMTDTKTNIYRCGSFQKRAVQLSYTGDQEVRLEKFVARIE